jgi:predicted Ser/Thr protein kinase
MSNKIKNEAPNFINTLKPSEVAFKIVMIKNRIQKVLSQQALLQEELDRYNTRLEQYYTRYQELTGEDLRPVKETPVAEEQKPEENYFFSNII